MYLLIKLIHIISGMVFFGLPFTFGRWFRTTMAEGSPQLQNIMLHKMKMFSFVHLNIAGSISLLTGMHLMMTSGGFLLWHKLSLVLMLLSLINLNLNLGLALINQGKNPEKTQHTRIRISIYSATHHTLISLIVALMVFRPI